MLQGAFLGTDLAEEAVEEGCSMIHTHWWGLKRGPLYCVCLCCTRHDFLVAVVEGKLNKEQGDRLAFNTPTTTDRLVPSGLLGKGV